jgi:hypothetical protein
MPNYGTRSGRVMVTWRQWPHPFLRAAERRAGVVHRLTPLGGAEDNTSRRVIASARSTWCSQRPRGPGGPTSDRGDIACGERNTHASRTQKKCSASSMACAPSRSGPSFGSAPPTPCGLEHQRRGFLIVRCRYLNGDARGPSRCAISTSAGSPHSG